MERNTLFLFKAGDSLARWLWFRDKKIIIINDDNDDDDVDDNDKIKQKRQLYEIKYHRKRTIRKERTVRTIFYPEITAKLLSG